MDRTQKEAAVAELTDGLKDAEAIFAVDYRGISVTEAAELRGSLREADASFKVVKNRLAKLAAAEAGTESIDELLVGPTALTLIQGDPVIAAKAIADFAKAHDELEYKGGIMDGAALDPDAFKAIARCPASTCCAASWSGSPRARSPAWSADSARWSRGLAVALGQIAEQGLVSGEAPAAEEPEPAAEEAPRPRRSPPPRPRRSPPPRPRSPPPRSPRPRRRRRLRPKRPPTERRAAATSTNFRGG